LTRVGYSDTPENTASLPSVAAAAAAASGGAVIMSWKLVNNASASATVRPLTLSVIIDADAFEIAHPVPTNETSAMRSPSSRR
jgi:hypothetical protein